MAEVTITVGSLCQPEPQGTSGGWRPACACGWRLNVSYGSEEEANFQWASYHRAGSTTSRDSTVVTVEKPETADPDRQRLDPIEVEAVRPNKRVSGLRRGHEGTAWPRSR